MKEYLLLDGNESVCSGSTRGWTIETLVNNLKEDGLAKQGHILIIHPPGVEYKITDAGAEKVKQQ